MQTVRPGRSAARRWAALIALAIGGFGIGINEFVTMGLLDQIAQSLEPAVWDLSRERAEARAGWLITAYAFGVVIGAPLITVATSRWSRKRLLLGILAWFAVTGFVTAAMPSIGALTVARFVAGLPHGVYFGVAAMVASKLLGPGSMARGVAMVMGGLTIANLVGVPVATSLGQAFGWRVGYVLVGVVFALSLVSVWLTVPMDDGDQTATVRRELSIFRSPHTWLTILMGAVGFGGFFATYSYITGISTEVSGVGAGTVPVVLVVFGLGMTLGNVAGGRWGDRSIPLTLLASVVIMLAGFLFGLAFLTQGLWALLVYGLVMGFGSSVVSPPAQARFMQVAPDAPTLAGATHHSAFNIANALGAYLGGLVIAAGYGYLSTLTLGIVLLLLGTLFGASSFLLERWVPIRPRQ